MARTVLIRPAASAGVSTAVGSSRTRILRATEEEADDLDPLLLADGELPDVGIGIDIEAEAGGEIADGGRGGIGASRPSPAAACR